MASHDDDISSALRNDPEAVASLMKSVSHRGRVSAMALLLTGEKGLSDLVEGTGLSKNAMVNHLSILMGSGLVRREERGTYALTADGSDLITSAATLYLNSELRAEEERRRAQRLYTGGRGGRGLEERMVSNVAVYPPCWERSAPARIISSGNSSPCWDASPRNGPRNAVPNRSRPRNRRR